MDAKAITAVFDHVLTAPNPRYPNRLQTYKINKFFNSDFESLIKHYGIEQFSCDNQQKAVVVQRFNAPSKLEYDHICLTVFPCATWILSKTWMTPTNTCATVSSA